MNTDTEIRFIKKCAKSKSRQLGLECTYLKPDPRNYGFHYSAAMDLVSALQEIVFLRDFQPNNCPYTQNASEEFSTKAFVSVHGFKEPVVFQLKDL